MPYEDPMLTCEVGWIIPADLCCAGDTDGVDCDGDTVTPTYSWTDEQLIKAASDILFARTCYRYPGECVRTVWPCLCCSCPCSSPCGCGVYSAIALTSDYPILSVDEVTINGDVVDDSLYRLDENARIVRTDGERWPWSNNLGMTNSPSSCQDEVLVTYTTGRVPPMTLLIAVAELACELKKACSGDPKCALPAHVRSVARRGVDYEMNDVIKLMDAGMTGNPIIDHALTVYGKCGRASLIDFSRSHRDVRDTRVVSS